jgi:ABC-2 type transport system ATP-binding protein
MNQTPAIEAIGLKKSYGDVAVLDGIDLEVASGTVLALLGPNGAGKTTTIGILSTLIEADAGRARVAGFDVVAERGEVRRRTSLTGQQAALDELLTGDENLRIVGRLRGLTRRAARRRAAQLLDRFGLADAGDRRVSAYSGGMQRRLDLAAGLVTEPEVLFLDEPTTGLDLRSRQVVWDAVRSLVTAGVTVLLTTQYLEEADQLADRIALLDRGRVVAAGTPSELKREVADQRLELTFAGSDAFGDAAARLGARALHSDPENLALAVATDGRAAYVRALLDELDPERDAIAGFAVRTATLDDVFLTLTGRTAERAEPETAHV